MRGRKLAERMKMTYVDWDIACCLAARDWAQQVVGEANQSDPITMGAAQPGPMIRLSASPRLERSNWTSIGVIEAVLRIYTAAMEGSLVRQTPATWYDYSESRYVSMAFESPHLSRGRHRRRQRGAWSGGDCCCCRRRTYDEVSC